MLEYDIVFEMKISIIVPCYNTETHVSSCFFSLQEQTFTDWEAIFINDGSNDNTLALLKEFAAKDSRIKVYTQTNQGAAKAREHGIKKATGDYLTFLDADDMLTPYALQSIALELKYNPDIIVSGFNIVKEGSVIKKKQVCFDKLDNLSYLKSVLCGKHGWELCSKVYKKELFIDLPQIPEGIRIGEDAAIFIQLVAKSKRIVGCNCAIYNYMQLPQSASHIQSVKYAEETLLAARFIEDYLKHRLFYKEIKTEISAMHLLFYSNSTFKSHLGRRHKLVEYVFTHHFRLKALLKIPKMKAIYILMLYIIGGRMINIVQRLRTFDSF